MLTVLMAEAVCPMNAEFLPISFRHLATFFANTFIALNGSKKGNFGALKFRVYNRRLCISLVISKHSFNGEGNFHFFFFSSTLQLQKKPTFGILKLDTQP